LKDAHLIETAVASDNRVISLDEEARLHYRQAAQVIGLLRDVCWVNPALANERAVEWLQTGAPAEKHRKLGYLSPEA
jgi:hypothetical protein